MNSLSPFTVAKPDARFAIIEMFGGDNNLSAYVAEDLREMSAGMGADMCVIALADYAGRPASVVEVTGQGEINVLEEWGEIDTGDPETLAHFLARALISVPNARKAIGFWDHGSGIFDEIDPNETVLERRLAPPTQPQRTHSRPARKLFFSRKNLKSAPQTRAMLHDETNAGVLTNLEAGKMLEAAFARAGFQGQTIDLLYSDTCLNGMVEVLDQLAGVAKCFVASADLEPGDGWGYHRWLQMTRDEPPASAADWGRQAVAAFDAQYRDRPLQHPCTLAAYSMEHGITEAFAKLIDVGRTEGARGFYTLDMARSRTQAFANRDTYDLIDFCKHIQELATSDSLREAAQALQEACVSAKVHSIALGDLVQDCNGLAFWFPSSRYSLRKSRDTYSRLTFDQETGWTAYLAEHR